MNVIEGLAADYPVFYLDPDKDGVESYRLTVLRGVVPENKTLTHYCGDAHDRDETVDTPAGSVRVITLGNRHDFELVIRGLMAAKNGTDVSVPESQGAAMLTVFNWRRINEHLAMFPKEERSAELVRFTSVKENYIDILVVLSRGGYSNISASAAGHNEEEWLELSDVIRRYHELTHVICRRLYPDNIDKVRDELIADAVGLYAAYGTFDLEKAKLFLGIDGGNYVGGRLENYTSEPEKEVGEVIRQLERIDKIILANSGVEPFGLIPALMQ